MLFLELHCMRKTDFKCLAKNCRSWKSVSLCHVVDIITYMYLCVCSVEPTQRMCSKVADASIDWVKIDWLIQARLDVASMQGLEEQKKYMLTRRSVFRMDFESSWLKPRSICSTSIDWMHFTWHRCCLLSFARATVRCTIFSTCMRTWCAGYLKKLWLGRLAKPELDNFCWPTMPLYWLYIAVNGGDHAKTVTCLVHVNEILKVRPQLWAPQVIAWRSPRAPYSNFTWVRHCLAEARSHMTESASLYNM